jgi:hypothetical protein
MPRIYKLVLDGMAAFLSPIQREIQRTFVGHRRRWSPTFDFFIGNHEERILRAINSDRKLDGLIGYHDFKLGVMDGTFIIP